MSQRFVLLFVHGAACDSRVWDRVGPWTGGADSVRAVDLPGHGRSSEEPLGSIGAMARHLAGLAAAHGARRVVLAGHSMGALVALEAASLLVAQGIAGLILLAPFDPRLVSRRLIDDSLMDPLGAIETMLLWSGPRDRPLPGEQAAAVRSIMAENAQALHADLRACADYEGCAAAVDSLPCRGLTLFGAQDRLAPAAAAEFLWGSPRMEPRTLDSCGHMMMVERPAAVTSAIADFLEKLP